MRDVWEVCNSKFELKNHLIFCLETEENRENVFRNSWSEVLLNKHKMMVSSMENKVSTGPARSLTQVLFTDAWAVWQQHLNTLVKSRSHYKWQIFSPSVLNFIYILFKMAVAPHRKHYLFIKNIIELIMFRERRADYCEIHTKVTNVLCWENSVFLHVEADVIYSYHCAWKG